MNRTFASEDERKTKLFDAWNSLLFEAWQRDPNEEFEEVYEGPATVSEISKNFIGLHLDDGRKLRDVVVNEPITRQSMRLDVMIIVLGKKQDKWWPLQLMSVGSVISRREFHVTINPLLIAAAARDGVAAPVH